MEEIYINSDGTVDIFDERGCKITDVDNTLKVLIYVEHCIQSRPADLPSGHRTSKPKFFFRISNTNKKLEISPNHFDKFVKHLKEANVSESENVLQSFNKNKEYETTD